MKAPHAVRWLERTAEEFEATGQRKHDVMKPAWRTPHFAPIGRWLSAHAQRLTIAIAMTTGDCRERASRLAWRRNRMAATKAWEEMIVPISRARRGLRGVKLVISDAHAGLKAAIRRASSASWQRCRVYLDSERAVLRAEDPSRAWWLPRQRAAAEQRWSDERTEREHRQQDVDCTGRLDKIGCARHQSPAKAQGVHTRHPGSDAWTARTIRAAMRSCWARPRPD